MPSAVSQAQGSFTVAMAGNPNSGKTTLFNSLTGLHQKTGNYPGVTVERKTGSWSFGSSRFELIDLPGCYSLIPRSPDEKVASDIIFGRDHGAPPDAIICVVDVTNLARHLYLAGQIIETGRPTIIALTMVDEAKRLGLSVDTRKLSSQLKVPVVEVVASKGQGLDQLGMDLDFILNRPWEAPSRAFQLPPALESKIKESAPQAGSTELQTLYCVAGQHTPACTDKLEKIAGKVRADLGVDEETVRRFIVEARYKWQRGVAHEVIRFEGKAGGNWTRRLDDIFLHRVFGPVILVAVLALVFQSVFTWASYPADAISFVTDEWLPGLVESVLAPGPLQSLLIDGVIAGVGAVVVFLPQILLIYLFLTLLEDSGYLSRAAFILDHFMSKVGLSGRSFIPLLSSFACAIPGIMATRTIPHQKDRLATILIAPLMTCSARLPIYALLIAAFVPETKVWGPFGYQGLTLLGLYLLGIFGAMIVAAVFRRTILRGPTPPLLLELPSYRIPRLKTLLITLWDRAKTFLVSAGTIIFAVSIVLWALFSYPHNDTIEQVHAAEMTELTAKGAGADEIDALENRTAAERLRYSFAGYIGRAMEPVLEPLGFDWKMGIGILGSFAAREVFVSTMGVTYGVGSSTDDASLSEKLKSDTHPQTGAPVWTPLVAITLMVFYAFALQCMSTIAIIKRETGGWKWPAFAFGYMTFLAYGAAFLTRQVGLYLF
jgi:ferrous iron transport protein B